MKKKEQIKILKGNLAVMRLEINDLRAGRQHMVLLQSALKDARARLEKANLCNGHTGASIDRITGIARDYDAQISELKERLEAFYAIARE